MSEQATHVAEVLDDFANRNWDNHIGGTTETISEYSRRMVENGTFTADGKISAELDLTLRERITGTRQQDVTPLFIVGAMVGAALERDVPADSDLEEAWRNGDFELPEDHNE